MVTGVSSGFEKRMEMVGTGYRASASSSELTLNVGYSKPRVLAIPQGVNVKVRSAQRAGQRTPAGVVVLCVDYSACSHVVCSRQQAGKFIAAASRPCHDYLVAFHGMPLTWGWEVQRCQGA